MGEFCSIRIAPINLDFRDIVDVFPFLNHKDAKGAKERLYVRRVKRRTYIVSPKGQSLLCVPCGLVVHCKQRGIMKIARLFKDLDKSGSAVFPTDMLRKDSTLLFEREDLRAEAHQSLQKSLPSLFEGKKVRFCKALISLIHCQDICYTQIGCPQNEYA
jgi:hypothetical protein